jgi:hypothetical protein
MIETFGTNFRARVGRHAEVIIGDENSSTFRPHIRIKRWGEECYASMGFPTLKNIAPTFDGTRIIWSDPANNIQARFYETPDPESGASDGGFEYDIRLLAAPASSVLPLPFSLSGLELFFQPPLTPAEIARGNKRPPHVVGSYAAYHSTKGALHRVAGDADKYRTGKAFHLYRPHAVDALGRRIWLDLIYDAVLGQMAIHLPPAWFAAATYPVVIDPTVGYTTLGASVEFANNYTMTCSFTAPESGDANPGTAFLGCNRTSGVGTLEVGAYVNGAANPNGKARLARSGTITPTAVMGFRSAAITWTGITAIAYWIGGFSSDFCNLAYDAGLTGWFRAISPQGQAPDPWGTNEGSVDERISVYVDYTAAGGTPVAQSYAISLEALASLVQARAENLEALASLSQGRLVSFEALSSIEQGRVLAFEALASVAQERATNLEALATIAQGRGANLEALASITQARAGNLEALAPVAQNRGANLEALGGVAQPRTINFEAKGDVAVSVLAVIPFEANADARIARVLGLEGLATAQRSTTLSIEALLSVALTPGGNIEALATIAAPRGAGIEALTALAGTATLPLEALQAIARAAGVPFEAMQGAVVAVIVNIIERTALFQIQLSETARYGRQQDETGRFAQTRNEDADF